MRIPTIAYGRRGYRKRAPFLSWCRRAVFLCAVAALSAGGVSHSALAQSRDVNVMPRTGDATLEQVQERRRQLFPRMMADPANLDIAFEYAALSSRAGDLEGAVSTLERMLIYAPDVPRLRLELGVLYFRLGSYELARSNFDRALDAPDVPKPVRIKVERYMAVIAERTAVSRFSGTIMFGTRYQSNANGGAGSRDIDLNGTGFILNDSALADPDTNAFVSSRFHYSHDLPSQGDRFDVDLTAYGALYAEHDEINTALGELTFGPVFDLARFGLDDAELGVYGILGGVVLGGDPYRLSAGVGVRVGKTFSPWTRGEVRFEYRYQEFRDSAQRPTVSNQTGDRFRLGGTLQHRLTDSLTAFGIVDLDRRSAWRGFESYWQVEGALGISYRFDSPFKDNARPWTASLSAGLARREFDDPDPGINKFEAQLDMEQFVRGTLTIPLRETWAMQAEVSYRNVNSNYDIDAFDNVGVSIGIMKSF